MALKGVIQKDVIAGNKYKVLFDGDEVLCVSVSAVEETLQTMDLPDGTRASGGRTEASEFTAIVPAHHNEDVAKMEIWWQSCQDPVLPTAYKTTSIIGTSTMGTTIRNDTHFGCFITGRTGAEYSLEDGGTTMTVIEYTISTDRSLHV